MCYIEATGITFILSWSIFPDRRSYFNQLSTCSHLTFIKIIKKPVLSADDNTGLFLEILLITRILGNYT
jgi:hypothetical protein